MNNKDCIDCEHFHDLDVYDERGNLIRTEAHIITRKNVDGNAVFYWSAYSPCCEHCEKLIKLMREKYEV